MSDGLAGLQLIITGSDIAPALSELLQQHRNNDGHVYLPLYSCSLLFLRIWKKTKTRVFLLTRRKLELKLTMIRISYNP